MKIFPRWDVGPYSEVKRAEFLLLFDVRQGSSQQFYLLRSFCSWGRIWPIYEKTPVWIQRSLIFSDKGWQVEREASSSGKRYLPAKIEGQLKKGDRESRGLGSSRKDELLLLTKDSCVLGLPTRLETVEKRNLIFLPFIPFCQPRIRNTGG